MTFLLLLSGCLWSGEQAPPSPELSVPPVGCMTVSVLPPMPSGCSFHSTNATGPGGQFRACKEAEDGRQFGYVAGAGVALNCWDGCDYELVVVPGAVETLPGRNFQLRDPGELTGLEACSVPYGGPALSKPYPDAWKRVE